jgi:hypothetical protein
MPRPITVAAPAVIAEAGSRKQKTESLTRHTLAFDAHALERNSRWGTRLGRSVRRICGKVPCRGLQVHVWAFVQSEVDASHAPQIRIGHVRAGIGPPSRHRARRNTLPDFEFQLQSPAYSFPHITTTFRRTTPINSAVN